MDRIRNRLGRWAVPALLVMLAGLAAGSLAWGIRSALSSSSDLMLRVEEVDLFLRGLDPYQDPDMAYPPSAPPIFTALIAPFPEAGLRAVWLALNLAMLAAFAGAVLRIWGEDWPRWLRAAVVLAIIATKPVRGGIAMGQFHLIPTALMLLSLLAARDRRPILGGLLLGVALAKPTMVLPFLFLLLIRRQWTVLAVAALVQVGCWLASSAWLGLSPLLLFREWLEVAKGQNAAGLIDLPSLINRNWPGLLGSATPLTLAVLLAGGGVLWALRDRSDRGLIAIATFVAAIFAYHRPYDMVLLIPTMAYLIHRAWEHRERGRWPFVLVVVFALALIWPNHPSAMGRFEALYEPIFVPLAYAYLAILIYQVTRGTKWASVAPEDADRGPRSPAARGTAEAQLARASS